MLSRSFAIKSTSRFAHSACSICRIFGILLFVAWLVLGGHVGRYEQKPAAAKRWWPTRITATIARCMRNSAMCVKASARADSRAKTRRPPQKRWRNNRFTNNKKPSAGSPGEGFRLRRQRGRFQSESNLAASVMVLQIHQQAISGRQFIGNCFQVRKAALQFRCRHMADEAHVQHLLRFVGGDEEPAGILASNHHFVR